MVFGTRTEVLSAKWPCRFWKRDSCNSRRAATRQGEGGGVTNLVGAVTRPAFEVRAASVLRVYKSCP